MLPASQNAILQINLIYFNPHNKNTFVNSLNTLKNSLPHWQKQNRQTWSTLLGLVCLTLANQNTAFLWSDNCSLFTDYTHLMHLSLNMLIYTTNSIMIHTDIPHAKHRRLHSAKEVPA